MMPRRDVSAERRRQILDAALKVFARKGFAAARTDDIAQEAGVSKGLLYWYFESKDAIIQGLLGLLFEPDLRALERLVAQRERPAGERLLDVARQALESLPSIEPVLPVAYEFYALAARPGPVRQALQSYYRQYRDLLSELVAQGTARGEWKVDDPHSIALAWLAQFEGLLWLWTLMPAEVNLEEAWMALAHRLLSLLTSPNGGGDQPR